MPGRLKCVALFLVASTLPVLATRAQQPAPDTKTATPPAAQTHAKAAAKASDIERIIEEGTKRSQVMATLSYLTDVIGPRLTGSPALKRANEWTRDKLRSWGLQNAHLEPWGPFGRGWTLKGFSAQIVEPQCIPLIAFPRAWSPGTEGKLTAPLVYFDAKTESDFAKFKGQLKGKFVLSGAPADITAHFEPLGTRLNDKQLLDLADSAAPGEPGSRRRRQPPTPTPGTPAVATPAGPLDRLAQAAINRKRLAFLLEEGVAGVFSPSRGGDGGTLFVEQANAAGAPTPATGARALSAWSKELTKNVVQVIVAREHYNRLVRMIAQGEKLVLTLDLAVEFHDKDLMAYNTVAEIPGTDLKDEVVMLGGHMDSWHSGTGATDNGAGVAVGMEAVRILKALDLKPRRTIRIALWSGEEQGLFGSKAYVTEHLGQVPGGGGGGMGAEFGGGTGTPAKVDKKPDYDKFSAYFNLDNGTGKVRGVYLQGNEAVRPIFRQWLAPFRTAGAATLSMSNTGGTDHLSFDAIGLPGFQFIQDEIEYDTRTHHSNQDVFDRIQADDLKQAATVMAAFIYNTANRDEKLPRKVRPAAR